MAYYLVTARLREELRPELQARLRHGEIERMQPFGPTLSRCLTTARVEPDTGLATWEELCYCSPPLAEEREAVLDRYFDTLTVERVAQGEGWSRIAALPPFWDPE